ncbi:MAG: hypothetical protein KAH91_04910 [Thermoplasmatales archaeon]|nr:hypothetical protein [Thermoplasmatales archaeon]
MRFSKLTKDVKVCNCYWVIIMKIRNIQLKSIEARRYINRNERPKQVRIDHNSTVSLITEVKENEALIDFQYTASYGPVGMIKLEGSLLYENDDAKKISEEWNKTRKMPNQIASQIHTAVMHTCVPEAVGIAKDLGLPPPIPLPQVRLGDSAKKGQAGVEVA